MRHLLTISIGLIISLACFGQSKSELEARKKAAINELENAKELLGTATRKKNNSLKRLRIIDASINSRVNVIDNINKEINFLDTRVDSLRFEVRQLNDVIKEGKKEYELIIISIYKTHTNEDKIMFLLASENINEFYQRIKYLKYLNDYRERKITEIQYKVERLKSLQENLLLQISEKEKLLSEKEKERLNLINERGDRADLVATLAKDERALRKKIEQNERISNELDRKINEMIEAEARASANRNLLSSLTPEQKLVGSNFEANKGRLPWPVDRGVITTRYGLINHPVLKGVKISNNGIDISAQEGTKARALFDGEVTGISAILGANYVVLIMHGEYITVYQNLIDLKVKVGEKVLAKQEIGTIHSDPDDHVAVMHLQIRKQKNPMNPETWLSK